MRKEESIGKLGLFGRIMSASCAMTINRIADNADKCFTKSYDEYETSSTTDVTVYKLDEEGRSVVYDSKRSLRSFYL